MNWDHLAEGIDVLRFWKAVPPQEGEAEIGVLKLSSPRLTELRNAPREFINKHKIFDKDIRSIDLEPIPQTYIGNSSALIVLKHNPTCTCYAAIAADLTLVAAA